MAEKRLLALVAAGLALRVAQCATLQAGAVHTWLLDERDVLGWGEATSVLGRADDGYGLNIGDEPSELAQGLPRLALPEAQFGNLSAVVPASQSQGSWFNCLVDRSELAAKAVVCWGECVAGCCGDGDLVPSFFNARVVDLGSADETIVDTQTGSKFACSLFSSGRVKCWGFNGDGRLGYGDTEHRGDDPGELGDALPFVDLGTDVKATQIAVGYAHVCAVVEGGLKAKCWGRNTEGQAGRDTDGDSIGAAAGQMGDALPLLDFGGPVAAIEAGSVHSCVILAVGRSLQCWGADSAGQIGRAALANATGPTVVDFGPDAPGVARVALGALHTCAQLENAELKCFGSRESGQIGIDVEGPNTRGTAPADLPAVDFGPGELVQLVAGGSHTCVGLADTQVRCWGWNHFGQLGHGAKYPDWGGLAAQMGAGLPAVPFSPTSSPTASPTASPSMPQPTPSPSASPSSAGSTPSPAPAPPTSSPVQVTQAPSSSPLHSSSAAPTASPSAAPARPPRTLLSACALLLLRQPP